MHEVWTLRGVPNNTRERAKKAAKRSGVSVGEVVTECINRHLDRRREDNLEGALRDLASAIDTLNTKHESLRKEVSRIEEQVLQAAKDVDRAVRAERAGVHPKEVRAPKTPTLFDLLSAYAESVERYQQRKEEENRSKIDPDAG